MENLEKMKNVLAGTEKMFGEQSRNIQAVYGDFVRLVKDADDYLSSNFVKIQNELLLFMHSIQGTLNEFAQDIKILEQREKTVDEKTELTNLKIKQLLDNTGKINEIEKNLKERAERQNVKEEEFALKTARYEKNMRAYEEEKKSFDIYKNQTVKELEQKVKDLADRTIHVTELRQMTEKEQTVIAAQQVELEKTKEKQKQFKKVLSELKK